MWQGTIVLLQSMLLATRAHPTIRGYEACSPPEHQVIATIVGELPPEHQGTNTIVGGLIGLIL